MLKFDGAPAQLGVVVARPDAQVAAHGREGALDDAGGELAHHRGGRVRPAGRGGRRAPRLVAGWTLSATDFLGLAELLATALVRSAPDPAALRALGREWGGYLIGRPGAKDVTDELPRVLERLGFQAVVDDEVIRSRRASAGV